MEAPGDIYELVHCSIIHNSKATGNNRRNLIWITSYSVGRAENEKVRHLGDQLQGATVIPRDR